MSCIMQNISTIYLVFYFWIPWWDKNDEDPVGGVSNFFLLYTKQCQEQFMLKKINKNYILSFTPRKPKTSKKN